LKDLPGDRADRQQQEYRVEQRRQDRRPAQAIGEPPGRRPPDQDARGPGDEQAEDVAEIVAGVGEQGYGIAQKPVDDLDENKPRAASSPWS